jgi:hypothetical protein
MDGGVANTARANTTVLTQAVNRQIWCMLLITAVQHNRRVHSIGFLSIRGVLDFRTVCRKNTN